MSAWDLDERGMTPDEWAGVLAAGAAAATGDLKAVLEAMAAECRHVERARESRHD